MLQCPVSAIPEQIFDLLVLWRDCRLMHTLPVAGGYDDQDPAVRHAFPIFEGQMRILEMSQGTGPQQAAALAVGSMLKLFTGGGRGRPSASRRGRR